MPPHTALSIPSALTARLSPLLAAVAYASSEADAAAGVNVTHELTKLLDVDGIIRNGSVDETLRVDKCVVGFLELVRRRRTTSSRKNNW